MLSTDGVCFALDENRNLIVPLRRISGVPAVRQGIESRLSMFKREWFLDADAGVPWIEDENHPKEDYILGVAFDEGRARHFIRKAILATPATSAESLQISFVYDGTTRTLDVEYNVNAVFDDVPTMIPVTGSITLEF